MQIKNFWKTEGKWERIQAMRIRNSGTNRRSALQIPRNRLDSIRISARRTSDSAFRAYISISAVHLMGCTHFPLPNLSGFSNLLLREGIDLSDFWQIIHRK